MRTLRSASAAVPPRSVLWGAGPVASGTAMVSSLPGYVISLAWQHGIPPVDLLHWIAEAAATDSVPGRSRADYEAMWTDLLRKPRASLSGLTRTTEIVVDAIDRLTGRREASATTVLGWREFIPTKGAFRKVRAYCACCYAEWGSPRSVIGVEVSPRPPLYEPLLWQFQALGVCVAHAVRLRTACPDPACGARRGALAAWAQPGYCACGTFLGESKEAVVLRDGAPSSEEIEWGAYVTEALSDLILSSPEERGPAGVTMAEAVRMAVARTHDGTFTPFAAAVRMSLGTVSLWKDGRRRPTLGAALRICAVAGFRLPDFLAGNLERLAASPVPKHVPPIPPPENKHVVHDRFAVAAALEFALVTQPAPSLAEVNRVLHISDRQLAREFPEQYRKIVARHTEWVEERSLQAQAVRQSAMLEAIAVVHARGDYPARNQVQELLPSNISIRDPRLTRLWKHEVVRLGYPRPDRPVRLAVLSRGRDR